MPAVGRFRAGGVRRSADATHPTTAATTAAAATAAATTTASATAPTTAASATAPTTAASATATPLLHLAGDRIEPLGIERGTGRGKQRVLLLVDVCAVGVHERLRDGGEVRNRGRVVGSAVEPLDQRIELRMQREVLAMLAGESLEERRELGVLAKAREERGLFVLLVTPHRAREEAGDVAERVDVGRRVPRLNCDRHQVLEALLETTMRSFELLERVSSFVAHARELRSVGDELGPAGAGGLWGRCGR